MPVFKIAIVALLLTLTGCAAEDDTDKKKDVDGMIIQAVEAQKVPMKRAEALEQQLQADFQKQKKEIDRQTGGTGNNDDDDG